MSQHADKHSTKDREEESQEAARLYHVGPSRIESPAFFARHVSDVRFCLFVNCPCQSSALRSGRAVGAAKGPVGRETHWPCRHFHRFSPSTPPLLAPSNGHFFDHRSSGSRLHLQTTSRTSLVASPCSGGTLVIVDEQGALNELLQSPSKKGS